MKLVRLRDGTLGMATDGGVQDLAPVIEADARRPSVDPMVQLIERFQELKPALSSLDTRSVARVLEAGDLGPPLARPRKILGLATDVESVDPAAGPPMDWFFKSPESVVGPGERIILPPHYATAFFAEPELAVVMARQCREVSPDSVDEVIFGYTAVLDVSAAGLGREMGTYFIKSFDTFCPLGPAIVVHEPSLDLSSWDVRLIQNGETAMSFAFGSLPHTLGGLIADVTSYVTLLPGDVVMCGSPTNERVQIAHGDELTVQISEIGSIGVSVVDPLFRHRVRVA